MWIGVKLITGLTHKAKKFCLAGRSPMRDRHLVVLNKLRRRALKRKDMLRKAWSYTKVKRRFLAEKV